jgi:DHA2 family lincomycin resistance protein-like MFS transporter
VTEKTVTEARVGSSTSDEAPEVMAPAHRTVVAVMLVSTFVVILNETIMNVALPRLMEDLRITAGTAQWVTAAFMLTMAVVIPVTGFVIQRLTTRATFLTAMGLFCLGTLVCAVAPGFGVLVLGRVVQASGTAIMMPLLMTTVMTVTPPARRGRTMGNISVVISVAPALGPTISGLILSVLPWRWLFGLVLPVAIGALVLGALRLTNITPSIRRPARVHVLSVLISVVAFGGTVYGLSRIGEIARGADPATAWVPLAVGVLALAAFVMLQVRLQRSDSALLDLRTFTSRVFSISMVLMAISMLALFGTFILLPIFAQNVLGLDVLQTGLLLLPGGLLMGLLARPVGRWYDAVGPRRLLVPGTTLVSASAWGMTTLTETSSPMLLLALHVLLSGGLALVFTPLFSSALGSLAPHLYSHGSAMVGTVQQVAGAAGTAMFVTVMTAQGAAIAAAGGGIVHATAVGVHAAFLVGALITLVSIPIAAAIRQSPAQLGAGAHG